MMDWSEEEPFYHGTSSLPEEDLTTTGADHPIYRNRSYLMKTPSWCS